MEEKQEEACQKNKNDIVVKVDESVNCVAGFSSGRPKTHCVEVRSAAAAPPRLLGPRFPIPRFPAKRRDPGTTELWMATTRASNRHGLRSTEGAVFSRAPKHRAGGISAALRSGQWVSHHRGSWAPAFAGETKGERGGIGKARRANLAESSLIGFPANAGIQGPPSSGWQPRGHRTAMASAARNAPSCYERTRAASGRNLLCAGVRRVRGATAGPRRPRSRG